MPTDALAVIVATLATIAECHHHRDSGAAETATCVGCAGPTDKVADGTIEGGYEAGFVPLCESCYNSRKRAETP